MEYLHLFEDSTAHDAVYNGEGYNEPWVALTEQNNLITFNKKIDYRNIVGSIAYFDGRKVKFTSKDAWASSMGTPIGVVVIPASHMQDGKCRVMSLCNMSYVTPETGTLGVGNSNYQTYGFNLMWGQSTADTQLPNFGKVQTLGGLSSSAYLPCDVYTSNGGYYTSGLTNAQKCPPLYLADGSRNPLCDTAGQALADMDGKANTSVLVNLSEIKGSYSGGAFENAQANYPAAFACHLFSTVGTSQGDWYLPACGELAYMAVRRKAINETMAALGASAVKVIDGSPSFGSWCWSSSEYYNNSALVLYNTGRVSNVGKNGDNSEVRVRAFAAF